MDFQMPVSHSYMEPVGSPGQIPVAIPNTSISCPANLTNVNADGIQLSEEQARALVKERQKKDNHNMSKYII